MLELYDKVSYKCSTSLTRKYSTSFSLGILLLSKKLRKHICAIYGFVRVADEIVDTFHGYEQKRMLNDFVKETFDAIENGISTNPILHAFQKTVNHYQIDHQLIHQFIHSMRMDLTPQNYTQSSYEEYILGSAEVVGLMCLQVFLEGDKKKYEELKPYAMRLGAVFQKVNFLRDLQHDFNQLNRTYFPDVDVKNLTEEQLSKIFKEIEEDFAEAFKGIVRLPSSSRFGVYLAYRYYFKLFKKIQRTSVEKILKQRIRIPNHEKYSILLRSLVRHTLNMY